MLGGAWQSSYAPAMEPKRPGSDEWVRRLAVCVLTLAFMLLLAHSYKRYVSPLFSYMGYRYYPLPLSREALLMAAAWFPSLLIPLSRRPSVLGYWILYLCVVIPGSLIPSYAKAAQAIPTAATLILAFILLGAIYHLPLGRPPRRSKRGVSPVVLIGAALMFAALYAQVFATFGFSIRPPSLDDVYNVRHEFVDSVAQSGRLVAYALAWLGNVLNPLLIAWGLVRRAPHLVAAGVMGEIILFGIGGHKNSLFLVVFVPALAMLGGIKDRRNTGVWVLIAALGLMLVGVAEHFALNSDYINSMFVRRQLNGPGLLTGFYFDFFTTNPKALMAHSVLKGIVPDRYASSPPVLIGRLHVGPKASANANLWADAYANFGYGGVLGVTVLTGLVFWTFDTAAQGADPRVSMVLLGTAAIKLSNTALATTLLTHGLVLAVFIAFFLPALQARKRPPPLARGKPGDVR